MTEIIKNAIEATVEQIKDNSDSKYVGLKEEVRKSVEYFQVALFPAFTGQNFAVCKECVNSELCKNRSDAERRTEALEKACNSIKKSLDCVVEEQKAIEYTKAIVEKIPEILKVLKTDIQAAYEGDPAASSIEEIILAYPAFPAISIFRIAHELYALNVPVIPRIMTEYAHELTGIDIHPGAKIGPYFFIDHGTGVVIGETTTIGEHVKLYQHVTLGAKSFDALPDGSLVKGIKRHPDIGNNVVIYSGATILGGDTIIGNNCIIGGNVWLTHSVRANQTVVR